MNIERVKPNSDSGIELYVSNDGTQSGVSQSGLARLCGITEAGLRMTLSARSNKGCNGVEFLEMGLPADFYLDLGSNQQAKVISSKYAAKLISFYAFKAVNKTDVAQYSLEKFVDIGIDKWIKDSIGYIETHGNGDQRLFDLLAIMGSDIKEMKADLASTAGYRAARITLPGLREWMEALDESDRNHLSMPPAGGEPLFTLNEWADVDQDGMVLDRKQKHALANILSSTYKMMALEMPAKVVRHNDKGHKLMPVQAYPERHFVLIRMCFAKLINR